MKKRIRSLARRIADLKAQTKRFRQVGGRVTVTLDHGKSVTILKDQTISNEPEVRR